MTTAEAIATIREATNHVYSSDEGTNSYALPEKTRVAALAALGVVKRALAEQQTELGGDETSPCAQAIQSIAEHYPVICDNFVSREPGVMGASCVNCGYPSGVHEVCEDDDDLAETTLESWKFACAGWRERAETAERALEGLGAEPRFGVSAEAVAKAMNYIATMTEGSAPDDLLSGIEYIVECSRDRVNDLEEGLSKMCLAVPAGVSAPQEIRNRAEIARLLLASADGDSSRPQNTEPEELEGKPSLSSAEAGK